jgi:hypothetical protein
MARLGGKFQDHEDAAWRSFGRMHDELDEAERAATCRRRFARILSANRFYGRFLSDAGSGDLQAWDEQAEARDRFADANEKIFDGCLRDVMTERQRRFMEND